MQIDDTNSQARIQDGLGQCFLTLREYGDAEDAFNDAIENDQGNVAFLQHRARCFNAQAKPDKAVVDLELANSMCKTDPQVLYELGLTYFADEKYKKCLKTLKEALRHNPYPTYIHDIFYHIGIAYCREEKFEKAIFPLGRCIDLMPTDIRYIHERAKAYQMIGMHE